MFGNDASLVVFDSFEFGVTGNHAPVFAVHSVTVVGFSVVVAVCLVPECLEYLLIFFYGHHPSPLYFYKWGNLVPIHTSLSLVLWQHWGFPVLGVVALSFWGRFEVNAGGIGQSFLNSNKFPDIFPALGHGVPAQVGILSSSGRLLSDVFSHGGFSFSEFIGALWAVAWL